MRASAIAIVICAFLSVGCGSDTCPVNAIRHVVVSVSADGLNARDFTLDITYREYVFCGV